MTSRLTFSEGNHQYRLADPTTGKKLLIPSVSALKKTLHAFDGERYFLGLAADAAADDWDTFAQLAPTSRRAELLAAAQKRAEAPRAFGTAVHWFCEQMWAGQPVEVPEEYVAHVRAVADWWTGEGVALVDAERMCWADGDEWGAGPMAGRLDLIVKHPTRGIGLCDLKTWTARSAGKPRPDEWAFQLAAYASMEYLVNEANEDVPFPHIDWCGVLHVGPPGAVLYVLPDEQRKRAAEQVTCARALRSLPKPTMEAM